MTRLAWLLATVSCSAPAAPPPAPVKPPAPAPVAPQPTCPEVASERGLPKPRWTHVDDTAGKLPCDGAVTTGLHGLVQKADGSALACAKVIVSRSDHALATGFTDAAGCYVLSQLPVGDVDVQIHWGDSVGRLLVEIPGTGFARFDGKLGK